MVPICAMLRISLSSDAAASLAIALTRATRSTDKRPFPNQTLALGSPPNACSRCRTCRADSIPNPTAALASVLTKLILARSSANTGRSVECVWATKAPSVSAIVPISDAIHKRLTPFCRSRQTLHVQFGKNR